jgi:hypothetical protein
MTHKYNAFYNNCIHLQWRYPKSTYIGNSHSKVIAWCKLYKVNVYDLFMKEDLPMCCISHSPYVIQNCKSFKDKSNQTMLDQFME